MLEELKRGAQWLGQAWSKVRQWFKGTWNKVKRAASAKSVRRVEYMFWAVCLLFLFVSLHSVTEVSDILNQTRSEISEVVETDTNQGPSFISPRVRDAIIENFEEQQNLIERIVLDFYSLPTASDARNLVSWEDLFDFLVIYGDTEGLASQLFTIIFFTILFVLAFSLLFKDPPILSIYHMLSNIHEDEEIEAQGETAVADQGFSLDRYLKRISDRSRIRARRIRSEAYLFLILGVLCGFSGLVVFVMLNAIAFRPLLQLLGFDISVPAGSSPDGGLSTGNIWRDLSPFFFDLLPKTIFVVSVEIFAVFLFNQYKRSINRYHQWEAIVRSRENARFLYHLSKESGISEKAKLKGISGLLSVLTQKFSDEEETSATLDPKIVAELEQLTGRINQVKELARP
jgi:hypothetical protein